MDMDNELEEFDRTGTPSLVGQSIRGEPKPRSESTSRASSKPNYKPSKSPEESSIRSLEQLHQEGVLLQDEEELDDILDEEGHIKNGALDLSEQKEGGDELKPPSSIDVKSINEHEEGDSFIAKDQEFIAPASSRDGSQSRSSSVQPPGVYKHRTAVDSNKPSKRSPLTESTTNLIDVTLDEDTTAPPEPSIKDIVNDYNDGHHQLNKSDDAEENEGEEEKEDEDAGEERQPRKPTRNYEDPQIPDSALAIDSELTVPAGSRDGSYARPTTTSNSLGEYVKSPERPHLARGDSYQNTVSNNDFSSTPSLNIGERRSRTSQRSESSLNYLRSISRSRSRISNDRNAIGEDRGMDEQELKEEGALMGDHYDQAPDLEDAVERALKLVQDEISSLGYDHADIPEEVEEEDEPSKGDPAEGDTKEIDESVEKEAEPAIDEPAAEEVTEDVEPVAALPESETKEEAPEAAKEALDDEAEEIEVKETKVPKPGADGSVHVPRASDKMTYEDEPVFIFTSLAGGFQIASRTNRLITILTANKVEYSVRDLGTDVDAKKIWRRYSGGKTLPGIVRGEDDFIGNWEDVEEANENYEVRSFIYETA